MPQFGLPMPDSPAPGSGAESVRPPQPTAKVISIGGVVNVGNQAAAQRLGEQAVTALAAQEQAQPVIAGLAGHIRDFWVQAKSARFAVEREMVEALMARRGQYTPDKLALIQDQRQPAIYMMVAAAKMRQVESMLRDVVIGAGTDKPWTLAHSPSPELPPDVVARAVQQLAAEIEQAAANGFPPSIEQAQTRLREIRDEVTPRLMETARTMCERMETKMEDQLLEGGYLTALDAFITDIATFKTAFVAGPVVRRKARLSWGEDGQMVVKTDLTLEWERVDPFDMFPAPWARDLDKSPLIRRHRLSREDLNEMIGVEGYSEPAIRKVLEQYNTTGLREWLAVDTQVASAEGRTQSQTQETGLIDALQFWGSASGRMLKDWGIEAAQVPDLDKEYPVEAWLVGTHVIKAVLNADPLARRPYYGASFQNVPGSVWGNSPYDLMRDCQDMCNAAARSLVANLGIASGPQVAILSNRLPAGEDVTEVYPWKIWQFESDPMGSTASPISFFQPSSNANELMQVYERFSTLADEYTGIPRYMAGFETAGAGRTASGMQMMIGNASKIIKQVIGTIDTRILTPLLERLYYYNMRYGDDPELKGDVQVVARGATSLVTKEAAQVRNNEFLQVALNSPVAQQIMGVEGVAEVLRGAAKNLDHNPDRVVPPLAVLKQRMAAEQAQALVQQARLAAMGGAPPAGPPGQGSPKQPGGGQNLASGGPVTDHFEPAAQAA